MPYSTDAQAEGIVGVSRLAGIASLSGSVPADVIAQARSDADAEIDAALASRYVVPFAAVTDTPATPAIVQSLSTWLTASNIYLTREADGDETKVWRAKAEQVLARILDGQYSVPGAAEHGAEDAAVGMTYDSDYKPLVSGRDSSGNDRMGSW